MEATHSNFISLEDLKNLWKGQIAKDFPQQTTIKPTSQKVYKDFPPEKIERQPSYPPEFQGNRPHRFVIARPGDSSQNPDYKIITTLGEGGMGIISSAHQASVDREIAVKMLKPEFANDQEYIKRFLLEGRLTGKLDHPNIVPVHELGCTQDNQIFMAMKKVKGVGWDKTIAQKSFKENLDILLKTSDAVAFAHSKGIMHRDIKPENVMLGEFGEVILMDWGIATNMNSEGKVEGLTPELAQAGTPAFMPPEVALCNVANISLRSDVYMLGGILFEICTGALPHSGVTIYDCLEAAAKNILPATDKKGELIDIALKALAANPDQRYASVPDFRKAVQDFLYHAESLALTNSAKEDLRKAGNDYSLLSRALTLFEEAVKLWDENEDAQKGIINTRKIYASIALARSDLDLGKSLVFLDIPEHKDISRALDKALNERKIHGIRLKILTYGLLIFIFATFFILIRTQHSLEVQMNRTIELVHQLEAEREVARKSLIETKETLEKEIRARKSAEDELRGIRSMLPKNETPGH